MPQLAAQLYTVRDFCKTPADLAQTLKKIRAMGYTAIQRSAVGPIDPKEFKKLLDDNGLACCATHISTDQMRDQTQQVLDDHALWGCKYTAIGGFWPKGDDFSTVGFAKFIAEYNELADKLAPGLRIGYHNHHHEFAKVPGTDKTAYQTLVEGLSEKVWIEVDTYWVQEGGADPVWWIDRVKGRIPCVHLKDMGVKTDRTKYMMEVGQGNLNWDGILAACKRAGVEWYIVEQDTCYRDPFESLKLSYDFLAAKGLN